MVLYKLARVYWRIVKPRTIGVRAIVLDDEGRVLLVRHSYQSGWYLPGGGVKRGESLRTALERELREEVGLSLSGPPRLFGAYTSFAERKSDHVVVFLVDSFTRVTATSREIAESGFFPPSDLPSDATRGTRRRIAELAGRPLDFAW